MMFDRLPFTQSSSQPAFTMATLTLSVLLSVASPAVSLADTKTTPAKAMTATQTPSKPATPAKKELPPVLSAEVKKSIADEAQKLDPQTRTELNRLSDSLHLEDKAINNELRDDEELSATDIGMLWEAAVEHSGTIRYAIEKLSRRDATGKPVDNDSFTKRVVQNLVHLGGIAGTMATGTPASMIGSNMVQDLIRGNPQDSALSHVTDADMVILAKEVEALQSQLMEQYYTYRQSQERLTMAREACTTIEKYYDHSLKTSGSNAESLQPLMQSMLDSAKREEQNALQSYNSSRSALGMVVGPDALAALDQSHNKTSSSAN